MSGKNIVRHRGMVSAGKRQRILEQKGYVFWLTGLSGSGKSTLAYGCEARLIESNHISFVLDGDNLRHGLNKDLGFSAGDRVENIRRVAEVAGLFADAGLIVLSAFISPYRDGREEARRTIGSNRFSEVYIEAPLPVCEQRDPKELYRQARSGDISDFTGVSAPYEAPPAPDLTVNTSENDVETCICHIMDHIRKKAFL